MAELAPAVIGFQTIAGSAPRAARGPRAATPARATDARRSFAGRASRTYFTPKADGVLTAQVEDSDELTFKTSLNVKPQ